jgi:hypothetical protein
MAIEHNLYFGSFCPKNTISCGMIITHSQYIGLSKLLPLMAPTYDPEPPKATRDCGIPLTPGHHIGRAHPSSLLLSPSLDS